ncbi:Transmembrane protein 41B [Sorochytrium milnesiophthora]
MAHREGIDSDDATLSGDKVALADRPYSPVSDNETTPLLLDASSSASRTGRSSRASRVYLRPSSPRRNCAREAPSEVVPVRQPKEKKTLSTRMAAGVVVVTFAVFALVIVQLYKTFPTLTDEERHKLRLPKSLAQLKELAGLVNGYTNSYFANVLAFYICIYVFLQTFAIPGSLMLSVLGGAIFPTALALFAICLSCAIGATGCYFISSFIGRPLVSRYFPQKVKDWKKKVKLHRRNITSYIVFLRVTPFLPNWFINIASPHLNISLMSFIVGTFIGVAPLGFIHVRAGRMLEQLSSAEDFSLLTPSNLIALTLFAALSLLPILLRKRTSHAEQDGHGSDDDDTSDSGGSDDEHEVSIVVETSDVRLPPPT